MIEKKEIIKVMKESREELLAMIPEDKAERGAELLDAVYGSVMMIVSMEINEKLGDEDEGIMDKIFGDK